jgi:DNA polymerase III sliding clamp (beta) subunit (PCNA family)
LVDEGQLVIDENSNLTLKAMDSSSISMVSASWDLRNYQAKPLKIGLNLENLAKIIPKKLPPDAEMRLRVMDNKLVLNWYQNKGFKQKKLQIIDVKKSVEKEPPVKEYKAFFDISGEKLKEVIKEASMVSSYMAMVCSQDGLMVMAKGDGGEAVEQIPRANLLKYAKEGADLTPEGKANKVSNTFNLDFFEHFVKIAKKDTAISISLKTAEPMKLSCAVDGVSFVYFLAPYMD